MMVETLRRVVVLVLIGEGFKDFRWLNVRYCLLAVAVLVLIGEGFKVRNGRGCDDPAGVAVLVLIGEGFKGPFIKLVE